MGPEPVSEPRVTPRPRLLVVLAGLLYLEAVIVAALTVLLIVDIVAQRPDSYLSAVALIVLGALCTLWLAVMATHSLAGRYWIRGSAITWQLLQGAVAITAIIGGVAWGWVLVAASVAVLAVLFTRPVMAATRRKTPVGP